MKRFLLNLGSDVLGRGFGAVIVEGAPKERVVSLVKKLRPHYDPMDLIRVGGERDGGYLLPRDIDSYDLLISPGIGASYDFDRYFFERNVDSVLIDSSVDIPNYKHVTHVKKMLGGYVSDSENKVTLNSLIDLYGCNKKKIILQMDIEGSEYEAISSTPETVLANFGIIVIEVHNLIGVSYRGMLPMIESMFERLLKNHFVAHIHANNSARVMRYAGMHIPDTLEFTFLNRTLYDTKEDAKFRSPHPLDVPCIASQTELAVPECWW